MAKKKQPDFQPTKLRVGKHLPKGRNVTNTSFKSKKIITKDQKLKTSTDNASLTDLIRLTHHMNVAVKTDALKKIEKYILTNDASLPAYFAEILKAMGKLFLDFNPKVRQGALNIINCAADILSDSQMRAFLHVLTSHINCMMTHINLSIKKSSLDLLSSLLNSHPNLICHSTTFLNNLLNMISSVKVQRGDSSSLSQKKRKLDDNISTTITSVEWRDQVMKIIAEFLEKLVETYAKQERPCKDEQKVYYDGIKPLFVQLYAGGGLFPAKLDFTLSHKSKGQVTEELKKFLSEIMSVVSDIVTEEMAGLNVSSNYNILRPENVEHLNTVTQVLCRIADWYSMDSEAEDPSFISEMNGILRKKLLKGYCYKMHESAKKGGRKNKEISCVNLNLGIGSLYCFFCLGRDPESASVENQVLCLVAEVLNNSQYQDVKTTSVILKILMSFLRVMANSVGEGQNKYNEEFTAIFKHLCEMARKYRDEALTEEIHSFFIKLSLDYDYKFLLDHGLLDSWTDYAFGEMRNMCTKRRKIDKELLQCINLMCSREYPSFLKRMERTELFEILGFLKLDDEDYQLTMINMITHMSNVPPNFLQVIAKFILVEQQLSLKIVLKLIRSLHNMFSDQSVGEKEFTEFSRFLLNVAFDVVAVERVIEKYSAEYFKGNNCSEDGSEQQQEEYSDEVIRSLFYVQSFCHYTVVPSQQWERHSKLVEVCVECLVTYHDRELTMNVATDFFHELLKSKRTLPIHSAMGLVKLATRVYMFEDYVIPNKIVVRFCDELMCCCLFYISIVTHKEHSDKCKAMGVGELQKVLDLDVEKAYNLSQIIVSKLFEQGLDDSSLLHILRIIKYFRVKNKIRAKDLMDFQELFRLVEIYCSEGSEQRAILAEIYDLIQ